MSGKRKNSFFSRKYVRYTEEHLKHRNIRFWVFYLILIILIVTAFVYAHGYFDRSLKEYEKAQYYHVADEMASVFTEQRYDELLALKSVQESIDETKFESREKYAERLRELTDGALIEYNRVYSMNPNEIRYQVTADGKVYAHFTLVDTGEKRSFDLVPLPGYTLAADIYEPGEISVSIHAENTFSYTVPDYASVSVNGSVLDESYITNTDSKLYVDGASPLYNMVTYTFSYSLGVPEIHVRGADGSELAMTDNGNGVFTYGESSVHVYKIPTTASISVDGAVLSDDFLYGKEEAMFFEGHMPPDTEAYRLRTYRFNYAAGAPDVSVTDADGSAVELTQTGENSYEFEFKYDTENLKPIYEATAVKFLQQYLLFSTHNVYIGSVNELMLKGSKAYTYVNNYEKTWITKADKTEFQDVVSNNYAYIADNCVTCEVYANYHTTTRNKVNDYPTKMRLYIAFQGDIKKIYDFELMPVETAENE